MALIDRVVFYFIVNGGDYMSEIIIAQAKVLSAVNIVNQPVPFNHLEMNMVMAIISDRPEVIGGTHIVVIPEDEHCSSLPGIGDVVDVKCYPDFYRNALVGN